MYFHSLPFLFFILVFFLIWPLTRGKSNLRWGFVVVASLFFYGWANWLFVFVLLGVGLISYFAGLAFERFQRVRKGIYLFSLAGVLSPLLLLRYSEFAVFNFDRLLRILGFSYDLPSLLPDFLVSFYPIGIAFYVLQAYAYLTETYRGNFQPSRNILMFFAYLSMFPKLIAGPIESGKTLLAQMAETKPGTDADRWEGTKMIAIGFFFKVVLSDNLSQVVNYAFENPTHNENSFFWWGAVTAFAFQIYFDFNGYSKIACGLAKWMGLDITDNFNHPYTAVSIGEFWQRWHISLSGWLRTYIFFPLSRSRWGRGKPHLNMWFTMLISGLWHGSDWHFVAWGGAFALFTSIERITRWPLRLKRLKAGRWLALLLVLLQVWIGWVFFRSSGMTQALLILKTMFTFSGGAVTGLALEPVHWLIMLVGVFYELIYFLKLDLYRFIPKRYAIGLESVLVVILIAASVFLRGTTTDFIYFQF